MPKVFSQRLLLKIPTQKVKDQWPQVRVLMQKVPII